MFPSGPPLSSIDMLTKPSVVEKSVASLVERYSELALQRDNDISTSRSPLRRESVIVEPSLVKRLLQWFVVQYDAQIAEPPSPNAVQNGEKITLKLERLVAQFIELWMDEHPEGLLNNVFLSEPENEGGKVPHPVTRLIYELVCLVRPSGPCVAVMQIVKKLLGSFEISESILREGADTSDFVRTPIGVLFPRLMSHDAVVVTEAWIVFKALLIGSDPDTSAATIAFISAHLSPFLKHVVACVNSKNYVCVRQMLQVLTLLVGQPQFAKIRVKFLDCPALLWAVMQATNDPSHNIKYESYHVLKVFLAKPNKILPIRHIIASNRELLAKYLVTFSTNDEVMDEQVEQERPVLLKRILATQPLTREEEVLLKGKQ